jgi:hypothetical protein
MMALAILVVAAAAPHSAPAARSISSLPSTTPIAAMSLRELDSGLGFCEGAEALVRSNPLRGLKELQKVHHSWPIPADYLGSSDPAFAGGLMHDYVRISGACSLSLEELNRTLLNSCAEICDAVAHTRTGAPPTITVNYSPWYHKFPSKDPTVTGPPEAAELAELRTQLMNLKSWLPAAGSGSTQLGAVLFDSEKFHYSTHDSATYRAALTRKHDLIWNLTRQVFPGVRIELYDRGAVEKWDTDPGWTVNTAYTLEEQGESLGVSLYTLPEIWNMRGRMNHTVALAQSAAGNRSGTTRSVTPWLSFGAGYRRQANASRPIKYDLCWDPGRVYSWQLGRELNNAWFSTDSRIQRYAPWYAAEVVCLYPSVFDVRGVSAWQDKLSTNLMQHFVAYVRGANMLDGLPA